MSRLIGVSVLVLILSLLIGCSKSGKGGDSLGGGNIPIASPGSELADINFAFDSSELDSTSKDRLRANSRWLQDNTNKSVVVEGHCDERGTNEYNMALGLRRAESVYTFLRGLGIKTSQMSTVSYGEEVPLNSASNEEAWAENRRAHFSIR